MLIHCKECTTEYSDQAPICPKCACPTPGHIANQGTFTKDLHSNLESNAKAQNKGRTKGLLVAGAGIAIFFATGLIAGSGESCVPTYPGFSHLTDETCTSFQTDGEKSASIAFQVLGGIATIAGLAYAFKKDHQNH